MWPTPSSEGTLEETVCLMKSMHISYMSALIWEKIKEGEGQKWKNAKEVEGQ